MKKIKKSIFAVVAAAVLAVSVGALAACGTAQKKLDSASVREYAAISAISVLATEPTLTPLRVNAQSGGELSTETKQAMIDNLALVQNTLNGNLSRSAVTQSDRAGFDKTYTLTLTDVTGETERFEFHYTQTSRTEERDETSTTYNGIVVYGGVEYEVYGETEVEGDEQEQALVVKQSERDYVVIEQETERGEESYSYEIFVDGRKVQETEISYERKWNGNVVMEFSIEQNGEEIEYEYEPFTQNGEHRIRVKAEREGRLGSKVEVGVIRCTTGTDGKTVYEFV